MINYEEIIENLQPELVIKLMEQLGADRYEDKGKYIIFPTICHNIASSEASSKLYFYKDTKLFYCFYCIQKFVIGTKLCRIFFYIRAN